MILTSLPQTLLSSRQDPLRRLADQWQALLPALAGSPLSRRLDQGRVTLEDYLQLLESVHRQLTEDALWISRGVLSFDAAHADLRAALAGRAVTLGCDLAMLEADILALGGEPGTRGGGADGSGAWLMAHAAVPNPLGLLGALWITAQLRGHLAGWVARIESLTGLQRCCTRFLDLSASEDSGSALIQRAGRTPQTCEDIVETAHRTGVRWVRLLGQIAAG